jgi:hypothetical protein
VTTPTLARTVIGAVAGAALAMLIGLLAVAMAPDNGFADLAAAAVTRVVLVPAGGVIGGIVAYRTRRPRPS